MAPTALAFPQNILQMKITLPGTTLVKPRELMVFTRQFATMLDAGMPLVSCLELLGNQADNSHFKAVLLQVKTTVEGGSTLANALAVHPKVFGVFYVNMVAAGETSGVLNAILNRLAAYTEKNLKLTKQVRSALVYPTLIVATASVVTLILLIFVIPVFQKMFNDAGNRLPAATLFVVGLSAFVRRYILILIGGFVALVVACKTLLKKPNIRFWWDGVLLKLPLVGPLIQRVAVAKFTRTMGTMLASGVTILDALDIVAAVAGNVVVEKGLRRTRLQISEGQTMARPLGEMGVFPPMVVQMVAVGEQTGAMDTMLNKIADFYDDEVDAAVTGLMGAIEPLIMAILAVVLGGLMIAMYLPMFTMASSVG